jgi:hypothetical protein
MIEPRTLKLSWETRQARSVVSVLLEKGTASYCLHHPFET